MRSDDLLDVAVAAARASAAVLLGYYEHGVREVEAKSTPKAKAEPAAGKGKGKDKKKD